MRHAVLFVVIVASLIAQPLVAQDAAPKGWVVVGRDSVLLVELGSCWTSSSEEICSDNMSMFQHPDSLRARELIVLREALAELTFELPPRRLAVTRKRYGIDERVEIAVETGLRMPSDPGRYMFRVWAEWENGDVLAAFRVRVLQEGTKALAAPNTAPPARAAIGGPRPNRP
jgi:hypothetical protein